MPSVQCNAKHYVAEIIQYNTMSDEVKRYADPSQLPAKDMRQYQANDNSDIQR